jgi:8-oxo-dGTP pyrophosphatase MutT (NUDIX family)
MRLEKDIQAIIAAGSFDKEVSERFLDRLEEGKPVRDENPESHFCAYFIPFDPVTRSVFFGHHRKSGLWLFNGGHIDANETTSETVEREMMEEWGVQLPFNPKPHLIFVTKIVSNPVGRPCAWHFDIHFHVPMDSSINPFDQEKLETEFYESRWMTLDEAKKVAIDPGTVRTIEVLGVI